MTRTKPALKILLLHKISRISGGCTSFRSWHTILKSLNLITDTFVSRMKDRLFLLHHYRLNWPVALADYKSKIASLDLHLCVHELAVWWNVGRDKMACMKNCNIDIRARQAR